MVLPSRGFFFAVLVILYSEDSVASRPDITTETDEIIKNEGSPLDIECSGFSQIYFVYPNASEDIHTTSTPEIEEHQEANGTYRAVFRRPQTVFGDTGWYGCADHPIEVTDPESDEDVSWVYVYVQSATQFFVEQYSYKALHKAVGETAIIPCRPTSPNLTVRLVHEDEYFEPDGRLSFYPRLGFALSNLTLRDTGYYNCMIDQDGMLQEVNYHLNVLRRHTLNEPKILDDTLRYVIRGQNLYVNCTTDIDADINYVFNWNTPKQSNRISTRPYSTIYGANIRRATLELMIKNVTAEDEGYYKCIINSFHDTKKTQKYIEVHDPDKKFINLTSENSQRHFQRRFGDKVQWVVNVNAYPPANLKWLNQKGEEIIGNWVSPEKTKYAINVLPSSTILRINRLDVNDMGIYSLQASNQDRIEMLNFTLDVISKPICLIEVQPYYAPNQLTEVICKIAAFPEPNITWSYLKCPDYPSCVNSTNVALTETKEGGAMTSFDSVAKMIVEMSGRLTCTACNIAGCDSVTENIFVSDGNGGFGLIEPKGPVTEGDDFELICAASIYNYTNTFEWKNDEDFPILETNRLRIVQDKTLFTYRSTLKIKDVKKEDSKLYTCKGSNTDHIVESMSYVLEVQGARAPIINETNMKIGEVTIDLNAHDHKSKDLTCFVDGMPKPNITWYKDDTALMPNEQYIFLKNRQQLHINYFIESDSGKYTCRVENRIGKTEAYQQITVKGKALPIGLIILIVVLLIIVVILSIYFTIKVRREKIMRKELMEAGLMHFEEGAIDCLNPDLTVDDQAELLPYDKKWEFPRERLKLGKQLGSGAFGVVMKADAQGICEAEAVTTVAVKMVLRTNNATYVRALASELKIMVHLGKHLNVVNLLGACTKNISKRELLVIVEYCRFGNLHNYLLRHRADFINQINPATGKFDPSIGMDILTRGHSIGSNNRIKYAALSFSRSLSGNSGTDSMHCQSSVDSNGVNTAPDSCMLSNNSSQPGWRSNYRGDYKDHNLKPICTQDLLSWAFQVARGMEYLSQRKVLHGDLAARNILLAENNIVKICDFGLAKTMYKDDNYKKKGDGPLPIKWMAIESIRDRIFSTQSDIWSFGIVLWEFFTLAETPYPGMEAEKQYQKLIEGYRMPQPEYATSEAYDIMLQCWKAKPTLRPSFTELVESIGDLLEESVRAHYISLNTPYMEMNTMMLEGGKNDYLTMLSAPDHATLSSPAHEYVNSPIPENPTDPAYLCMSPTSQKSESGIFSPRPHEERSHFEFPAPTSDSEDAVEMSPMLKKQEEEDPYLKPINVHERRAEFARRRQQAMKNQAAEEPVDRDSGYCNAPRNLQLIDLYEKKKHPRDVDDREEVDSAKKKDFMPSLIRTQDNYLNLPQQKIDLKENMPDGFSNPSYVMMSTHELDEMKV